MANTRAVRDAIADAEPVGLPGMTKKSAPARPPVRPRGGGGGGDGFNGGPPIWEGDLPPNCPLRPVGKMGVKCVFLDALGQLTIAGPRELGEAWLTDYFAGDAAYLQEWFPRITAEGVIKGFSPEDARRGVQAACSKRGIWEDMERVRGRGAWRDDDGSLVLHCGDVILMGGQVVKPGDFGDQVYPAGGPILRPLKAGERLVPAHDANAAAWRIMKLLKGWNWRRGSLDARLFLGAIVSSFLGGALKWRPHGWATAESGGGKSTLQRLRREIMGGWSLNASDASAAGVYSRVKFDALGVSLDEQESEEDNRKLDAMVKLARSASQGDLVLRGSSTHEGVAFSARNSFFFSSINSPALRAQDMSRIVQLDLYDIAKGQAEPDWSQTQAQNWGREILRRCLDHWGRFDATLEAHRAELKRLGHDSRGQDTFGTLMACADLVLSERGFLSDDGPNEDPDAAVWDQLQAKLMPEYTEKTKNWRAVIQHLLSSRPNQWKVGAAGSVGGLCAEFMRTRDGGRDGMTLDEVNAFLALGGCAVALPRDGPFAGVYCLGLPNQHQALAALFQGTRWPGVPDAPGGWAKALGKADADIVLKGERFRVDGQQHRGVLVRLDQVVSWQGDGREDDLGA